MSYRVLISYSWKNAAERRALTAELTRIEGVEIVSDKMITLGTPIHIRLSELINSSDCIIALLTPESIASHEVTDELARAHDRKKRIIPVLRQNIPEKDIPWYLKDTRQLRYTEETFDDMLDELILLIQETVIPSVTPSSRPLSTSPTPKPPLSKEPPKILVAKVFSSSGESINVTGPKLSWNTTGSSMLGNRHSSKVKLAKLKLKSEFATYNFTFNELKELRIIKYEKDKGIEIRIETLLGVTRQGFLFPPGAEDMPGGSPGFSYSLSSLKSTPALDGTDEEGLDVSIILTDLARIDWHHLDESEV